MPASPTKLSFGRIALYSMASAGLNILSISVSTWLLYFYAPPSDSGRIQYLPAALVGGLLFVMSLWDALIDPFIGHFSDNLRSKWGRRRPFLILGAPAVAILVVLLWTPPAAPTWLTALYCLLTVLGFYTAFSLVGIPYDATLPEMAPESQPRVRLSYWKYVFGLIGVIIGSVAAAPLFESAGPLAMGAVVGVVALVTIWLSLLGLREAPRRQVAPMPVLEGLKVTLKNRQFLVLLISTLLVHVAYQMVIINLPYFVTQVVGRSEADVAIFMGVLLLVMGVTGPLWTQLNKRITQKTLLNIAMAAMTVCFALLFLVGGVPIPPFVLGLVLLGLMGVGLGGYFIIVYALMGNVVDYDEMLTGRRREANFYGTFSLALGIGIAVGSLILPQFHTWLGNTQANPLGVRVPFLAMAGFVLAGLLVFLKYRLGDTPLETRRNLGLPEPVEPRHAYKEIPTDPSLDKQ